MNIRYDLGSANDVGGYFRSLKIGNYLARYFAEEANSQKYFGDLRLSEGTDEAKLGLATILLQCEAGVLSPVTYEMSLADYHRFWLQEMEREACLAADVFEMYVRQGLENWREDEGLEWDIFVVYSELLADERFRSDVPTIDVRNRVKTGNIRNSELEWLRGNLNKTGWQVFCHFVFCATMLRQAKERLEDEAVVRDFPRLKSPGRGNLLGRIWRFLKKVFPAYRDWDDR